METLMYLSILVPILSGIILLILPEKKMSRVSLCTAVGVVLSATALLVGFTLINNTGEMVEVYRLTARLTLAFRIDTVGAVFVSVVSVVWVAAGFFAFTYMQHEEHEKRYYGFYLIVYGILIALDFAGNLVTYYACFEQMTICSMPMVLHNQSKEAIMAGLKYLFYSFFGAYMVLFGFYFLFKYAVSLDFVPGGGNVSPILMQGHRSLMLVAAFCMIQGFSVKAGMFPLHGWLPTAHPVAPAPASAALSGIIVKAGVLGVVRVIFYLFGTDFLKGTWVQTTCLILALITVFMGSMLAYREKVLKKRLAYSTVSQVSYILFGLFMMNATSFTGSILHVVCHALIKCALFLVAGALIFHTGKTGVDDFTGIGKKMPVLLWCYTIVSLGLIGIPPMGGFISKWYLATGSLEEGTAVFSWLGPVILLVSALLTAGYLLPITIKGFLPGKNYDVSSVVHKEPSVCMIVPILVLTVLSVLVGLFPSVLTDVLTPLTESLFGMTM